MADLKYNTDQMRDSATLYRTAAESMTDIKAELGAQVSGLEDTYWKSSAGEAFLEVYQDDWANSVDKYVAVLKQMADLLDRAARDYDTIVKKLNAIEGVSLS